MKLAHGIVRTALGLLGLSLAGCGSMGILYDPLAVKCPGGCDVTVTVNSCSAISVDKPTISFDKGVTGNINWDISGAPNWEFLENGIEFKTSTTEFDGKQKTSRKFKWHNKHTMQGKHGYNVWLTPDGGKTRCKHDPTILNY